MEENPIPSPTVMSTSIKFGAIIAAVSIVIFIIRVVLGGNPFESDWTSWISLLVSIAIIVFAHKSFKDGGDGFMSYGQGFGIATLAMLISLVVGCAFSYFYSSFIDTTLMERMLQATEEKMREQGQNDEAIAVAIEWTQKLFWPIYLLFGGFFCVVIGAIVPIFTQKKNQQAQM